MQSLRREVDDHLDRWRYGGIYRPPTIGKVMARRNYKKTSPKNMQPAPMTLTFGIPLSQAARTSYIDLSQCASLVNRRFYRQGINWAVAGFKFIANSGQAGEVTIGKLPNTWIMSNSWEKSMRVWTRMNREALAETDSVAPRFLDFKIYADAQHHAAGFGANLLPSAHAPGEWSSSKASIPLVSPAGAFNPGDTVEREFVAVGASYPGVSAATGFDALSLIEGYASSRGLPNIADPNTPADALDIGGGTPENWMQAIFNEGTDQASDVIEDMITENTVAPYPFENDGVNLDTMYPGGANNASALQIHDYTNFTASTISSISRMKGGNFPCGLIRFDTTNWNLGPGEEGVLLLLVDLVPGHHRGYLCEPMTEM